MPWLETNPVLERQHFVHDLDSGHWTMTELCLRYGISRNTGYKWLQRFRQSGARGLHDHSRAPRSCPHQTPDVVVQLILAEHARFGWDARKILKKEANPASIESKSYSSIGRLKKAALSHLPFFFTITQAPNHFNCGSGLPSSST